MEIRIIMLVNLLAYSFIASQSFSYIMAMTNVQKNMQPASYIELRKLLDKNYNVSYRIVFYIAIFTAVLLTLLCSMDPGCLLFISSAIGLVALLAEVLLAVKGNVPINKIINTWTADDYPANWQQYRTKWLAIFTIRQIVTIAGLISLLAGAIFGL